MSSRRLFRCLLTTLACLLVLAASLATWHFAQLRYAVTLCNANNIRYTLGNPEPSELVTWLREKIGPLPFDVFTELRLYGQVEDQDLKAIFRHAPQLTRFNCMMCNIEPETLANLDLSKAKILAFTDSDLSSFDTSLFTKSKQLEKLFVQYCNLKDVSCEGFDELSKLNQIAIDELKAGDEAFINLCKCSKLEEMDLRLRSSRSVDFALLKSLPHLKVLNFIGFGAKVHTFAAVSETSIKDLWINRCVIDDPVIPTIAKSNCIFAGFTRCVQLQEYRHILPISFQNKKLDHVVFSNTNVTFHDALNLILRFDVLHEIYMPHTTTRDQDFASYSLYLISHGKELFHSLTP